MAHNIKGRTISPVTENMPEIGDNRTPDYSSDIPSVIHGYRQLPADSADGASQTLLANPR